MSDVVGEDEHSYFVRGAKGKPVRVAKTAGTKAQYGKPETSDDFASWNPTKLKGYDEALSFLEQAKTSPQHRELLMGNGGLDPAKAAQMAKYRAWRYKLDQTGGDDAKLKQIGMSGEQIAAARKQVGEDNAKKLASAYDMFVKPPEKEAPTKPTQRPVHARPKPVAAAPKPAGAEGAPPVAPAPAPMAPVVVGDPAPATPPAPIEAGAIIPPQPVATMNGQPVQTALVTPPDEEQRRQLLAQAE